MATYSEIRKSQAAQAKAKELRDEQANYEKAKLIVATYEAKHKKPRKAKKSAE